MHTGQNLFEKIVSLENLLNAWEEFRRGKRNKVDVQTFEMNLEDNLFEIHQELKNQTWHPSPYKAFYISDPKLRHIHKACVRDRVVHQAVFRILYPVFDSEFIFDSYSCRVNKGTHRAVVRLETFCRRLSKNYRLPIFALKCDIARFFDSVDHNVLRKLFLLKLSDERVLSLTDSILASFSVNVNQGLPLGNVTSQLFANIYMNELDKFIKHHLKVKHYIRYTDDFVFVSRDMYYLKNLLPRIESFLFEKLKLRLHSKKIIFRKLSQGIDFLGYVVLPHHKVLRTKTKRRMFRKLPGKKDVSKSLPSYLGVLKHCNGYKLTSRLISQDPVSFSNEALSAFPKSLILL